MPDSPLVAVVEIPKGSSNKYEWDEELGAIKLDRLLFSSLGYPTDYGFFRNTLAGDGKTPEWKVVKVDGWYPREEALESIERAQRRFRDTQV